MNLFTSIGLDLSTKATGLVFLGASGTPTPKLLEERIVAYPKETGIQRTRCIVLEIMEFITEHQPDRIVVEGYSLNLRNAKSVVPLVELGGLLRFMLKLDGYEWFDPRASELKKFVTGKGTGDKAQVMMHVLKRWDHTSKSNDTADAYGLACMGLAHANRLPGITQEMRGVVGKMKTVSN